MADGIAVTHNEAEHRFEAAVGGQVAVLTYKETPHSLVLLHTEVPKQLGGRGIGGQLASTALAYARQAGLRVVPKCPFVLKYMEWHPEQPPPNPS